MNEHLTSYLSYYCDLKEPQYAVMIDGPWGSGKTFLIRDFLNRRFDDNNKYLFVSLYGINSVEEIEQELFRQMHPVLGSKSARLIGRVSRSMLKGVLKIDLSNDASLDVKGELPELKIFGTKPNSDRVLIFDDVERCLLEPAKLLGYINGFVEQGRFNVILLSNEREIHKSDKSYSHTREKLIGKTFKLDIDTDAAVDSFFGLVEDSTAKSVLREHKETITEIQKQSAYGNLRTLRFAILESSRILQSFPRKILDNKLFVRSFLKYFLASFIELRTGNITEEQVANFLEGFLLKDDDYVSSLRKKYPILNKYSPLLSMEEWTPLLVKGAVNTEELEVAILNSSYFLDETRPNWVALWHYRDLEDADFKSRLGVELSQWDKSNSYTDIGIVLQLSAMFLSFSNQGLLKRSSSTVLNQSKRIIRELNQKNLLPSPDHFGRRDTNSYQGLGFYRHDNPRFKEVLDYLREQAIAQRQAALPKEAAQLLKLLKDDPLEFCQAINLTNSEKNKYYNIAILHYISPIDFAKVLISAKNKDKDLLGESLEKRYEFNNFLAVLKPERDWLVELRTRLLTYINNKPTSVSTTNLKRIVTCAIEPAIEKLESQEG